jgi:hypothetical protein
MVGGLCRGRLLSRTSLLSDLTCLAYQSTIISYFLTLT